MLTNFLKGRIAIMVLLLSSILVELGYAQAYWSASICTAVPAFYPTAAIDVKTQTWFSLAHGYGVQFRTNQIDSATLFVPVTATQGQCFRCIKLRADDNGGGMAAFVKATLYQQPNCGSGPAVSLGSVTTTDIAAGGGFQCRSISLPAPVILNYACYSYYILVRLARTNVNQLIRAYDVSLHYDCQFACP